MGIEDGQIPATPPGLPQSASGRIVCGGQQRALLSALEERNRLLGTMYLGGLTVLADTSNPDRFSLCAHALRELMEKLPEYLDVPTPAHKESLKQKVIEIESAYGGMSKKTACAHVEKGWDGPIDAHLRKFLLGLAKFLEWFATHHPRRQAELHGTLRRLDGSGRELPLPLESLNADAWSKMREYFQAVSHHRKQGDDREFASWVDALERFLLDRFLPRTFDDLAEIDAILGAEGSHG